MTITKHNIFQIDGKEFTKLPIIEYDPYYAVVDGGGTGRMQAIGQRMFRDPSGTFINFQLMLGGPMIRGQEREFHELCQIIKSYGREQWHRITHLDPDESTVISQNMYCTSAKFSMVVVSFQGEPFWKPLKLSFIAQEAYVV